MRAEEMFDKYHQMKRELELLEFQLSRFNGIKPEDIIEAITFSHPEGERVQTSGTSDKTGKLAVSFRQIAEKENDDWFQYLLGKHQFIQEEIEFFEYGLIHLVNAEIIRDMVVEKISWSVIEKKYSISHAMLGKYRKSAIMEMNRMYEIRDKQAESYMLS